MPCANCRCLYCNIMLYMEYLILMAISNGFLVMLRVLCLKIVISFTIYDEVFVVGEIYLEE